MPESKSHTTSSGQPLQEHRDGCTGMVQRIRFPHRDITVRIRICVADVRERAGRVAGGLHLRGY
uniref:Uncharacterized protein n=1 Tax=Anguilla anguilla TaxID=7936 RepID=A0A0E9W144_ANGAN